MACFLVPATEAIVTTIVEKTVKSKEGKKAQKQIETGSAEEASAVPFSRKLGWLNKMLWGGSALLAFEHIWHGEVTPFFPFLTAMENADDALAMLHEMSTIGVAMAFAVTAVWGAMVMVSGRIARQQEMETATVSVTEEEER